MFRYCDTVLKLILAILQFVRATRTADIELYIQALARIVPFFFALDHHLHARWLPVHLRDLLNLPNNHPRLWEAFKAGYFVAAKSYRRFSTIALDQAHEQLNAILKGNSGKKITKIVEDFVIYFLFGLFYLYYFFHRNRWLD